jgi:ABC-type multidrug transport system fused ATPase/permease subunit
VGVTISRVVSDVGVINQLLSQGLVMLIGDMLLLGGVVAVMITLSPQLALVTLAVIPVMVVATLVFAQQAKTAFRETRAKIAAVIGDMAENIAGMRVIQAFAQEDTSLEQFDAVNRANRDAMIDAISLSFIFLPTMTFLGIVATAIVLWFGGIRAPPGSEETSAGDRNSWADN